LRSVKDQFVIACLQADVNWAVTDGLIGLVYLIIIIVSIACFNSPKYQFRAIISLFVSTILCLQLTLYIIIPKIEAHTQNAAIEFYKSLKYKDCYIEVLGFKSYAQLFYTEKKPLQKSEAYSKDWLLSDKIDKPAYFVTKIHKAEMLKDKYKLKEIYRKNGFVFLINETVNDH